MYEKLIVGVKLITIEMFPAEGGDCFLISFNDDSKTHILIDSGYAYTYNNYLKKKLIELNNIEEKISLFVTTHLHADHIAGGIEFLNDNGDSNTPNVIYIDEIWHNSFRHLQFKKRDSHKTSRVENIILQGIIDKGIPESVPNESFQNKSAKQGSSFGSLILKGGYNWNKSFNNEVISVDDDLPEVELTKDIRLTILSPTIKKLEKLDNFWRKELQKLNFGFKINNDTIFDDAFEFLLSREKVSKKEKGFSNKSSSNMSLSDFLKEDYSPDTTVVNGSSISFIIEFNNKKLLFLADSHSNDIENGIKKIIKTRKDFNCYFDCVKISHHGSKNNTSPSLLELFDSDVFLVSTDGAKHNHPDLETIARIVCRESKYKRNLYFNYQSKIIDYLSKDDYINKYNYSVEAKNKITI